MKEIPLKDMPYVNIPLHTLIKLKPVAYGCDDSFIKFDVEAVDTHRPRSLTFI